MEVHHHSHTDRKRFKHYLWEFLMLFLAVFCGFFAEYKLEHRIEKEKAQQYIHSFYEDLKEDTAEFSTILKNYSQAHTELDKSKECFEIIKKNPAADSCLARIFSASSGFTDLITADQTLLQLKNSGGFRLLQKSDADSILRYDKMIRLYSKTETTGFQQNQYFIRETIYALRNYEWEPENKTNGPRILFSDNKPLLNTYFNALNRWVRVSQNLVTQLISLKQQAIGLLYYFNNKYEID